METESRRQLRDNVRRIAAEVDRLAHSVEAGAAWFAEQGVDPEEYGDNALGGWLDSTLEINERGNREVGAGEWNHAGWRILVCYGGPTITVELPAAEGSGGEVLGYWGGDSASWPVSYTAADAMRWILSGYRVDAP
jgi:hypothetical protein